MGECRRGQLRSCYHVAIDKVYTVMIVREGDECMLFICTMDIPQWSREPSQGAENPLMQGNPGQLPCSPGASSQCVLFLAYIYILLPHQGCTSCNYNLCITTLVAYCQNVCYIWLASGSIPSSVYFSFSCSVVYLTSLPPHVGASDHTVSLLAVTVVLVLECSTGGEGS